MDNDDIDPDIIAEARKIARQYGKKDTGNVISFPKIFKNEPVSAKDSSFYDTALYYLHMLTVFGRALLLITISIILAVASYLIYTSNNAPGHCTIKGKVTPIGMYYYMPGSSLYNQIKVNPDMGDIWFCSKLDAKAAGFIEYR